MYKNNQLLGLFLFVVVATVLSLPAVAKADTQTDLADSQRKVIQLMQEKAKLMDQISQSIHLGSICMNDNYEEASCLAQQTNLKNMSNSRVIFDAGCTLDFNSNPDSVCYGRHWTIHPTVRFVIPSAGN